MLRIKGSGSDLATVEARHFPGLWLDELLPLRERDAMSDEEMVDYLARCMVEPEAPRPSIETLLHAFLPAAHVDHVHADAICALANAPDPGGGPRGARGRRRRRPVPAARVRALAPRRRSRRCAGGRARPSRARHLGRDARGVLRADAGARRSRAGASSRRARPRQACGEAARPDGSRRFSRGFEAGSRRSNGRCS